MSDGYGMSYSRWDADGNVSPFLEQDGPGATIHGRIHDLGTWPDNAQYCGIQRLAQFTQHLHSTSDLNDNVCIVSNVFADNGWCQSLQAAATKAGSAKTIMLPCLHCLGDMSPTRRHAHTAQVAVDIRNPISVRGMTCE